MSTIYNTQSCTQIGGGAKLQASECGLNRFLNDRFGLSVHWGLYSLLGRSEWALYNDKISIPEYEQLALRFNPIGFDAEEWAQAMVDAGQRMLLITAKHHDGFCLFDSALTDWKITNTPFRRDPLAELAQACERHGIKLHFYYSLLDWHHPAYLYDWPAYVRYYQGQIRELCTHYGEIGGILFDGYWPNPTFLEMPTAAHFFGQGDWDFASVYDLIHSLRPDAVITNNHHVLPIPGEDYQMFEHDMPGENITGFSADEISNKPLATWQTLNRSWCYNARDDDFKPPGIIIRMLLKTVGKGACMFLNVGPDSFGRIQPAELDYLREIGKWLRPCADALYDTRPVAGVSGNWGYAVHKADKIYLYVLNWPGRRLAVSGLPFAPSRARVLGGSETELAVWSEGDQVVVEFPAGPFDPRATIVEL